MMIPRSKHQRFGTSKRAKDVSNRLSFEILLVDDEPLILSALSLCLKDSSHGVTTALSGQDALDLLRRRPFDLVITDLQMPGLDGITLMKRTKELRSDTKVIIMTGSVLSESAKQRIFQEADGFLPKPFSLSELHQAVSSCLAVEVLPSDPCKQGFTGSLEALAP